MGGGGALEPENLLYLPFLSPDGNFQLIKASLAF